MSLMTAEKLQSIIEAALMVAGHPLSIAALQNLFNDDERPGHADIKTALAGIRERHQDSGIELHEVASGYRLQAKAELSPWLAKLWEERAPRYSRAFLETLAIIAYKQPITRAEIEEIRGVTVSTNIIKTLSEREWVRLIGYRDTPGKPALYGTTKTFLDHFSLTSLSSLPTLAEFKDMQTQEAELQVQLALENSNIGPDNSEVIPEERDAVMAETDSGIETNVVVVEAESDVVVVIDVETETEVAAAADTEIEAEIDVETEEAELEEAETEAELKADADTEAGHETQLAATNITNIDAHEELNQEHVSEVDEDIDETDLALAQS
jgi:segregation and condensation protein B